MWKRSGSRSSDSERDLRNKYAKEKLDRYYGKGANRSQFASSYFEGSNSRTIILIQLFLLFLTIICCIYFYIENTTNKSIISQSESRISSLIKEQSHLSEQLAHSKQQIDAMHKDLENRHKDSKNDQNGDNSDNSDPNSDNNDKNEENSQNNVKYNDMVRRIGDYSLRSNKLRYNGLNQVKIRLETSLGLIIFELAPFDMMPHVTNYFLTLVESGYWNNCHFFRAANHVIQANCHHKTNDDNEQVGPNYPYNPPSLLFQEYNENYLHNPYTIGIAGRPGGPDFYINLVDNIRNHGPGGQGPEPDPCFGKVIKGFDVIDEIKKLKRKQDSDMMVLEDDQWVKFLSVTVITDDNDV